VKRRIVVGLVAVALLAVGLLGAGRTRLVFSNWHMVEPHWERSLREAIGQFMAENPDIEVVFDIVSYAEKETKYMTAIEAGVGPDVMHLAPVEISFGLFAPRGYFYDLTSFIAAEAPGFLDAWYPGVVDTLSYEGRVYGLGANYQGMVLMWNKRLFAEAGLDPEKPPQTWDEFLAYARALTRDRDGDGRIDTWGVGIPGRAGPGFPLRFTPVLFSHGGDFLSADFKCAIINSPAAKEAFRFFVEMFTVHRVIPPGVAAMTPGGVREQFAAETVAMILTSAWGPPIIRSLRPAVNWDEILGMTQVPVKAGTDPAIRTTAFLSYYAINRNTRHPEAAWRLLRFVTSREMQQKWFRDANVLSARRDVSEEYEPLLANPFARIVGISLGYAAMMPLIPEWPQISDLITVAIQRGWMGDDLDVAWAEAYRRINEILAVYRARGETCPPF